jgi:hypothetical protein
MIKSFILIRAIALMPLGDAENANAKVVRWELQGVRFNDGATASGFFLLDTDGPRYAPLRGWDVLVELGPNGEQGNGPGYHFSSAYDPHGITWEKQIVDLASPTLYDVDPVGRTSLQLQFSLDHPLTEFVGRADITYGFQGYSYPGVFRYISAGEVVALPEPAAALLLGFGFALLGATALLRNPAALTGLCLRRASRRRQALELGLRASLPVEIATQCAMRKAV